MKVSELRLSLSRRNLSTTGLKKDLLTRLLEVIDKENAIVSASAAKSSNRSVSAPKNPRQIPVTSDEGEKLGGVSATSYEHGICSRNSA